MGPRLCSTGCRSQGMGLGPVAVVVMRLSELKLHQYYKPKYYHPSNSLMGVSSGESFVYSQLIQKNFGVKSLKRPFVLYVCLT